MGMNWVKRRRLFVCLGMVAMLALFSCPVKHLIKSQLGIDANKTAAAKVNAEVASFKISASSEHCNQTDAVKIKYTVTHDAVNQILPPADVPAAYNASTFPQGFSLLLAFNNKCFPNAGAIPPFLRNKSLLI